MKLALSLIMAVIIGLCFTPAWAQDEVNDFSSGEKLQTLFLGGQAWKPAKGAECLDFKEQREVFWSDRGECAEEDQNYPLTAVIRLPSGAKFASAELLTYDNEQRDPYTIKCEINREDWNNAPVTQNARTRIIATLSTDPDNQAPGYTSSGKISVQERVKNTDYWYQAVCFLGDGVRAQGVDLRLFGMRIFYRLQVNTNLPTAFTDIGHLYPRFQEAINALAAAGITKGCNPEGTLYCPDKPITRGEMAVFLAEKNGLYWPASQGY